MPRPQVELLDRSIQFYRTGQNAFGTVAWLAFKNERESDEWLGEVEVALAGCDYLRVADVIEYGIRPLYAAAPPA